MARRRTGTVSTDMVMGTGTGTQSCKHASFAENSTNNAEFAYTSKLAAAGWVAAAPFSLSESPGPRH